MNYFTGKSDKRHWNVEAPYYPGTWHGTSWSSPEWSYPVNAGLCVSCHALVLQSLSWLPLWVPRERLFTASANSQTYDMHRFYKMLRQVQILIFLSQDRFVLILKCCAFALFVNAISGAEVSKALSPSVSRQSKSVMGAWLEILQSTRFWIIQICWERSRLFLTIRDLSQISKLGTISTFGMAHTLFSVLPDRIFQETLLTSLLHTKTWILPCVWVALWGCQGDGYSSLIFHVAPGPCSAEASASWQNFPRDHCNVGFRAPCTLSFPS